MKYLVLWSGGLDSTYLVWKLLNEGHSVMVARCVIGGNEYQRQREEKARNELFPLFKNFSNFEYVDNTVAVDIASVCGPKNDNNILPQIPALLVTALYSVGRSIDRVALGYVMNDDAISFLDDIKGVFNSFKNLMWNQNIEIEFPLAKISKVTILYNLPKEYLERVSYCENNDSIKVCGKCPSCKRHKDALLRSR